MQIQFDPRDPSQLATVARIVSALQGGAAIVPYDPAEPHAVTIANETAPVVNAADVFAAPPLPPVTVPVAPRGDIDDPDEEPGNAAPHVLPAEHTAAATTPTPPPAPSQPVAAAPAGVDVDKNGFPWDARIHSGPADKRPKNADGTWRRRRGTDDATVAQVEAELRQIMGAGNAVAVAPVPPAPVAAAPTPAPTPPPPTPVAADTAPGPVAATTAPSAPTGEMTFPELMRKITALQSSGTLTVAGTNEIAVGLGLTGVRDLMHRPDMVASFAALLPEQAA